MWEIGRVGTGFDHHVNGGDAGYCHGKFGVVFQHDQHGVKELESTVSQWAHVDALLMWILIYSYDVNWRTPYSWSLGSEDSLCNCRARTRMRAHWLLDGSAGSLVCQYQLTSLTCTSITKLYVEHENDVM